MLSKAAVYDNLIIRCAAHVTCPADTGSPQVVPRDVWFERYDVEIADRISTLAVERLAAVYENEAATGNGDVMLPAGRRLG